MADNVDITPGTGATVAADEIDGVKYQRVKIVVGTEGANDGDASSTTPLPISGAVTNADITSCKTALEIIDDWDDSNYCNVNLNIAGADVTAGAGAVAATTQRITLASDDPAVVSLAILDDWDSGDTCKVTAQAGTAAIGKLLPPDVDVTTNSNYTKKYYTNAGAVTDGIIWSPGAGKRWHIHTIYINVSAAATVTLEDDLAGGDSAIWKGELAANSGVVMTFPEKYPWASGEDAADLIVTTSAGNVYITVTGYEI